GIRDAELVHDARDTRRADARDAREQFAHPERSLGARGVGPCRLGDLEGTSFAAVHGVFHRGPGTARGDSRPTGRGAVDLGHAHLGHEATSRAVASIAEAIPSGPAAKIARETVGNTAPRATPKVAGAPARAAPCAPNPGARTGTVASTAGSTPTEARSAVAPTTTPATPPLSVASRTMRRGIVSPSGARSVCTSALSGFDVAASTKTPLPWASARASTPSREPKPW